MSLRDNNPQIAQIKKKTWDSREGLFCCRNQVHQAASLLFLLPCFLNLCNLCNLWM